MKRESVFFLCLCLTALHANPSAQSTGDFVFDPAEKVLPAGMRIGGEVYEKAGQKVRAFNGEYVTGILKFQCGGSTDLRLEMEAGTEGFPPSELGVILFRSEKGNLVQLERACWNRGMKKDSFEKIDFSFPASLFKDGESYEIYVYCSNLKGTFLLKSLKLSFLQEKRGARLFYQETPDLVGPLSPGKSGIPDYHIRIVGVRPEKSISGIEVLNDLGGRWVSGDEVKKNFWMIQYYDSKDFPSRTNPKNNFDGTVHSGLSSIDLLFESPGGSPDGVTYRCVVHYSDGTLDEWTISPPPPPELVKPLDFSYRENLLTARSDWRIAPEWKQPVLGKHTFWQLMSPKEELDQDLLMRGDTLQRVWSMAWFYPYAGLNPNPGPEELTWAGVPLAARAVLREFQVFDAEGKEVSGKAKVSCEGGMKNLSRINDGSTETEKAAESESVLNGKAGAVVTLTFPTPVPFGKTVLHHGVKNGSALGWISSDFALEYQENGEWKSVPGGSITGNRAEKTEHSLSGISSSALRLRILDQKKLADYGNADWRTGNPRLKLQKTDPISPELPFYYWYLGHDAPTFFAMPENPSVDPENYLIWRKKHPYFLGFQLTEFDNDLPMFLGWNIEKGSLAAKFFDQASENMVIQRGFPPPPKTQEEALKQYENAFRLFQRFHFGDSANFCGISIWHHYGMEWGALTTVLENGGGGSPVLAMQAAAARGASRQYGNKPWGFYMAVFLGSGYTDHWAKYTKEGSYHKGTDCGKSASLYRRELFLSYLMGVSFIDYEHFDHVFAMTKPVPGKMPELSPHGKAVLELQEFDKRHPVRGDVYAPVALLLDWSHGWRHQESSKIFCGLFEPTPGDRNLDVWMNGIFGLNQPPREGYGFPMCRTGFGGMTDILMLNPPSGTPKILDAYKAAILAGDHRMDSKTAENLKDYVRNGGTLIVNSEQMCKEFGEDFTGVRFTGKTLAGSETVLAEGGKNLAGGGKPYEYREANVTKAGILMKTPDGKPLATVDSYGKGRVVLTLQKYLMEEPSNTSEKQGLPTIGALLSMLRHEVFPVIVSGDRPVQTAMNRLPDGWRLMLMNDFGIYKNGDSTTPPVVTESEKSTQKIVFKGILKSAVEQISGKELRMEKDPSGRSVFTVEIPPGDLAVIDMYPE